MPDRAGESIALAALVRPFGIEPTVPEARTEVRAVYGGFGVATGVLLGWAATLTDDGDLRRGIAVSVAVALAGMAWGRLAARLVERPSRFCPSWFSFWVELVGAGLLMWAG
ncbi:DUF4345 family protein [Streptomyces sp. NPDC001970]